MTKTSVRTWMDILIEQSGQHTLAGIARDRRLVRHSAQGATRVTLSQIDQSALVLSELAIAKRRNISFLYPIPAGEIAVLLAAQIMLQRYLAGDQAPSVGLVTADPARATRIWGELSIAAQALRASLSEMFPCYRAEPDGESPFTGRKCPRGLLIGSRSKGWRVDTIVEDHLAGHVSGVYVVPTVRVFADPLDPVLTRLAAAEDELVWVWSATEIAEAADDARDDSIVSLGSSHHLGSNVLDAPIARLCVLADGVESTIEVATNDSAEECIHRIRDDLRTLADLCGPLPPPSVIHGLRVAWHHVSTLASLPCRPSDFDRFAGIPPLAARSTATFAPEIDAWARVLAGDAGEIASVIASDLGDLRAALEDHPPYLGEFSEAVHTLSAAPTLAVVGTETAARGLLRALRGDPDRDSIGALHIRTMRRLYREGPWPTAFIVGMPAPWDWHRIASGISPDLRILVIGGIDARRSRSSLLALHDRRLQLASGQVRRRVWHALVGKQFPDEMLVSDVLPNIAIESACVLADDPDPLEPLAALLHSKPLSIAMDDSAELLAEETDDGHWSVTVDAVRVVTDYGVIMLPRHRSMEVREGDKIVDCAAEHLHAGMLLLIGRKAGRLGLLEAIADRLRQRRPDLIAAHLLIGHLQTTIRKAFQASGMSKVELFEALKALGFDKTYGAAIRYVEKDGPLAPRDPADLKRLLKALEVDWDEQRIAETVAGVKRQRVFRRTAGRILAQVARGAATAADVGRVDPETGLSIADLRDSIIEAEVLQVVPCLEPVQISEIGRLNHVV